MKTPPITTPPGFKRLRHNQYCTSIRGDRVLVAGEWILVRGAENGEFCRVGNTPVITPDPPLKPMTCEVAREQLPRLALALRNKADAIEATLRGEKVEFDADGKWFEDEPGYERLLNHYQFFRPKRYVHNNSIQPSRETPATPKKNPCDCVDWGATRCTSDCASNRPYVAPKYAVQSEAVRGEPRLYWVVKTLAVHRKFNDDACRVTNNTTSKQSATRWCEAFIAGKEPTGRAWRMGQ